MTQAQGKQEYRTEHDTMGEVQVPIDALWRAQTQRAVENFPISHRPLERTQIRAMGLLKAACATVNKDLGLLDAERADAIISAFAEPAARDLNVINMNGKMVERLHLEQAQRLVTKARHMSERKTKA